MEIEAAYQLAVELIEEHLGHLDNKWKLNLNKHHSALGRCDHSRNLIELSVYFIQYNEAKDVREITLHEIAHALAGCDVGHGKEWADQCRRLGIEPIVTYHDMKMPEGKWVATCKKCNQQYNKHRKPACGYQYLCRKCNILLEFRATKESGT